MDLDDSRILPAPFAGSSDGRANSEGLRCGGYKDQHIIRVAALNLIGVMKVKIMP